MVCVYCGGKTEVVNSRVQKRSNQTWRRRNCTTCLAVFTTGETVDFARSLGVISKKARLSPFVRDKLFVSIHLACGHRKDAVAAAGALTDTVISGLIPQIDNASLTSRQIAQITAKVLKRFDEFAGATYLAYHPL